MRISDLDYDLPEGLIAQEPLAQRDASRLLLVDVEAGEIGERMFVVMLAASGAGENRHPEAAFVTVVALFR